MKTDHFGQPRRDVAVARAGAALVTALAVHTVLVIRAVVGALALLALLALLTPRLGRVLQRREESGERGGAVGRREARAA